MQTFLPYSNFQQSAACLDNKRLGKQRVECLQIFNVLAIGSHQWWCTDTKRWRSVQHDHTDLTVRVRKTPWYDHPAVNMWRGWECTLMEYSSAVCKEWVKRGFKDTCLNKIVVIHYGGLACSHSVANRQQGYNEYYTPWLGNEAFHASHRSNLLRKDPEHYKQFNWTEPNNLPYVWPV